jgi:hypothetical protein
MWTCSRGPRGAAGFEFVILSLLLSTNRSLSREIFRDLDQVGKPLVLATWVGLFTSIRIMPRTDQRTLADFGDKYRDGVQLNHPSPFTIAPSAICRLGTALYTATFRKEHTCNESLIDILIREEHRKWLGANC